MNRCGLAAALILFSTSTLSADLQPGDTGVEADVSLDLVTVGKQSHPNSVTTSLSDFVSPVSQPAEVQGGFFGSAVISSDDPIAATIIEVKQQQSLSYSALGTERDASAGSKSQVGFTIQNVGSDIVNVNIDFQQNVTLTSTTDPNPNNTGQSFTGANVGLATLADVELSGPPTPIFSGFASMDQSGTPDLSGGFVGSVVVTDAGSTSTESRKNLQYSSQIIATVQGNESYQVVANSFCGVFVPNGFTASDSSTYSCFNDNTFDLQITSDNPNVRFSLVNTVAVPEPSQWICLALVCSGVGTVQGVRRWRGQRQR